MRSVLAAERDTDGVVGKPELETILLSFSQDCLGIAGALPVWSLIGIEAVALGRIWMMFHETFGFWSMGFLDYVSVGKDSEPHESESAPLLSTGFCRFRIWQLSGKHYRKESCSKLWVLSRTRVLLFKCIIPTSPSHPPKREYADRKGVCRGYFCSSRGGCAQLAVAFRGVKYVCERQPDQIVTR